MKVFEDTSEEIIEKDYILITGIDDSLKLTCILLKRSIELCYIIGFILLIFFFD